MTIEKNIFDLSLMGNLLILEDKQTVSSHQLNSSVPIQLKKLLSLGIAPGHKVVLCLGNTKEFCDYLIALGKIGACIVPISPHSTKHEIEKIINHIKPSLIIFQDGKEELLKNAELTAHENAFILHTSGSSGKPKGVIITRMALEKKLQIYKNHLHLNEWSNTLCMLPLNFGHGLISNFLFPLLQGQQVILAPNGRMDIYSALGEIVDEYGVTCFSSVPSILKIAANFSSAPVKKSLKTIFSASAPLDMMTWENAYEWSGGIRANNMYGMTEMASWIAGDLKTAGQNYDENTFDLPWEAEIKIQKENDSDEYGEILVKSQAMMSGYYLDENNTQKVLSNGWFKTGDMGLLSSTGIHLKGRIDNVINLAGVKVYPEEINQLIKKHPKIQDCYTLGLKLKDKDSDHGIGCILVPKAGCVLEVSEFQELCKENLSIYKVPSQFKILDKLPTNERGKIDSASIKQIFSSK